jgi:hypothetical protein
MDIFEININSKETLLEAFDVLHDATCNEDDIKYDTEAGTLDIIFAREFFEDPANINVRRRMFIFHKIEFPIVKSHLHLDGLSFCKIQSKDKSFTTHMFNECKHKENKYFLCFCEVLEIAIEFKSSITGYLKDLEFIEGKKGSYYSFGR